MSYYTHFEINCEAETTDALLDFVRAYVRKKGWSEDCLGGFREALDGVGSVNKIYGEDLEELVCALSTVFPRSWFGVRGFGEEFRDIWIREFRAGRLIFSNGPFDENREE
jgi:hypothetical protein